MQKKIYARVFSYATLKKMRWSTVKRIEGAKGTEAVAIVLGLNRCTIFRPLSYFHYGGKDLYRAKPAPGAPPKLWAEIMSMLAHFCALQKSLANQGRAEIRDSSC